jgi:hypothetical protein
MSINTTCGDLVLYLAISEYTVKVNGEHIPPRISNPSRERELI